MQITNQTSGLVFFNVLLWGILNILTKDGFSTGYLTKKRTNVIVVLILVFCLFSFWGQDWFGYLKYFDVIKSGEDILSLEYPYKWIIKNLSPNYIIFRLIIWGSALFFFYETLKKLRLNIPVAFYFFTSIYLIWFSYARVTLAMAMIFYGLALLHSNERRKFWTIIKGWGFILLSFYFHKSSFFCIIVVVMVELVLMLRLNRKGVLCLIFAFVPLFLYILSYVLKSSVLFIMDDETSVLNNYMNSGSSYLLSEDKNIGIGAFISVLLERLPYFLIAYLCVGSIVKKVELSKQLEPFIWILILLVLEASLFAFDLGMNTNVLYGRLMRYTQIPACIVLTYFYTNNIYAKYIRYIYKLAILGSLYSLLYVLYNTIVKGF